MALKSHPKTIFYLLTIWLTIWCLQTNVTQKWQATGLISSLLDIASSWDIPFRQLQQFYISIMFLLTFTFVLLCTPFLSPQPHRWWFALHALWLQYTFFWLIILVCTLTIEHSIFSVMAGLIVEILLCCSPFIVLCNELNMSEYKAYWLKDNLLINNWEFGKNNNWLWSW